jgi:hypothetical protein
MRKRSYQDRNLVYRYYKKFCNLQKRISMLMQSGEFFDLSREIQHRLMRRLKLLFERVQRLAGKQKLRWAGAAMALLLTTFAANAQFNAPVLLSGFNAGNQASPNFVDFDNDGDLDIVIGSYYGDVSYVQNDAGKYAKAVNPFSSVDTYYSAAPAVADVDDDGDLDLIVGGLYGIFQYFQNDADSYSEITGVGNPFDGFDVGYNSAPFIIDVDDDGDLDMISGALDGVISFFENDGSGVFTQMTGVDNPFDAINGGTGCVPRLVDFDEDGDLDLYIGAKYSGAISYFENDGGAYTEITGGDNPFNGVVLPEDNTSPVVLDVDDDADLDLVVGDAYSQVLRFFRNDAGTFTEKRGTPNPFEGLLGLSGGAAPAFSDIDNDGDLDLLIGEKYGSLRYFQNTNEGFIPNLGDIAFDTIPSNLAKPAFADADDDGDEDMVVGAYDGSLYYFSKEGANDLVELTGTGNPFNGIDVNVYSSPAFSDIDEDGDLDLFVGSKISAYPDPTVGFMSYFRNVSGEFVEQTGAANPFESMLLTDTIASGLNPAFIDMDRDGDMDLFVGSKYGYGIQYYVNDGGAFTLAEGDDNPLNGVNFGYSLSPAFADLDEDGDLDLYVGASSYYGDGQVFYFENTQGPPVAVPAITDIKGTIDIYSYGLTLVVDPGNQILERVEVYSLSGQVVRTVDLKQQGRYELNLPEARPGLYIVRAFSDGKPTTEKVMLK